MHSRFNRSDGTTQDVGNFLVTQMFAEAQDQCLTLTIGQLSDLGPQAPLPFGSLNWRFGLLARIGWTRVTTPQHPKFTSPGPLAPPLTAFEVEQNSI